MATPIVRNPGVNRNALRPGNAEYDALKAKFDALLAKEQARNTSTLTVRIMTVRADGTAGKGGIAVFGLQRNPVTLYAEQWERLLAGVEAPAGTVVAQILEAAKDPSATRKNG